MIGSDLEYKNMEKEVLSLIQRTNFLIKKGKEIEKLKGEKFNLFTIMNMEEKEVNTHSAFISELLNAKGSHLMENVFLKLFLKMLVDKGISSEVLNNFKAEKSISVKEKYISPTDYDKQIGGSIDIYVSDNKNSISIENKIYAKDQNCQLLRYYKYNTDKNLLLYLTLEGNQASDESILITNDYLPKQFEDVKFENKLIEGCHYFLISYKTDIIPWLNECIKESTNSPILRESIKQYLILIKKLTSTMNDSEQKELEDLIINNRNAAKYISENYANAINKVRENLRNSVIESLRENLGNDFIVVAGYDFPKTPTQIWINYKKEYQKLCFGIESFNGGSDGIYIGMIKESRNELIFNNKVKSKKGDLWIEEDVENLGFDLDLFDTDTLIQLHKNNKNTVDRIVAQLLKYIDKHIDFVNEVNSL